MKKINWWKVAWEAVLLALRIHKDNHKDDTQHAEKCPICGHKSFLT